ncbi:MAG: 4Fe-4S binding protein [Desulfobacterales bacterium]|nr:4Fe-4S binding protein [Desulfobacterales bacterium]
MILSKFRRITQVSSTILSNSYIGTLYTKTVNTNPLKGMCVPFLNCYACPSAVFSCPIGTLQHFMAIQAIPFYLMSFILLVGFTTGRMACGWLCPFGLFQDLMYKIKAPKYKIPYFLSYIKYLVLIFLVLLIPYYTGEVWFSKLCPAGRLTAGIPWAIWNPINPQTGHFILGDGPGVLFYLSLLILIGFMIWFAVSKRPFCRVACPMGAILSLFNKFSMIRLEIGKNCDGCSLCQNICPVDLNISIEVDSSECIRCLECTRCGHVRLVSPFKELGDVRQKIK